MPNTAYYRKLSKEVRQMRRFLPKPNLFGKYTPFSIRRMIAFRLLCHAALETYLEAVSTALLKECHDLHQDIDLTNDLLLSVCMRFARLGNHTDANFLNKQKGNIKLLIEDARLWHINIIDKNNGIREANQKALFDSFGTHILNVFDPVSVKLDNYGVIRGEYAHRAAYDIIVPDPADEWNAISDIVLSLKAPDQEIYVIIDAI